MSEDSERSARQAAELLQRKRGERAERVAGWYFRLNGFLSIPGFVVHPDVVRRHPLTEADLIAVRFPNSHEVIDGRVMNDDRRLIRLASASQVLFLLVEVKLDQCQINGPWTDPQKGSMQRVIRRMGFANDATVDQIAAEMYRDLRWEDERTAVQYVAVGKRTNEGVGRSYPQLLQVTWDDIAVFLFDRFVQFPEKLPGDARFIHEQWPDFGKFYGKCFRQLGGHEESKAFVSSYIEQGSTAVA